MKSKIMLFARILALAAAVFAADPPKNANANADPAAVTTNSASAERDGGPTTSVRKARRGFAPIAAVATLRRINFHLA